MSWARGDLGAAANGSYVSAASDGNATLSSCLTWDLQLSWGIPWDGTITFGARNVFDEDPPLDFEQLGNPYLRYEQDL